MTKTPNDISPEVLKKSKILLVVNIIVTIVIFVLYFIARQHNFESLHEGTTSTYYAKMKYFNWLGGLNALYTAYLFYRYRKLKQEAEKEL